MNTFWDQCDAFRYALNMAKLTGKRYRVNRNASGFWEANPTVFMFRKGADYIKDRFIMIGAGGGRTNEPFCAWTLDGDD